MKRRRKPVLGDLLLMAWGEKIPYHYRFDLTQEEFYAIGVITVQWAFLESALYQRTAALAKRHRVPIPLDATNASFTRRLRAFRALVRETIKREAMRKYYLTLAQRIGSAEGYRHRVTHDCWSYNPKNPTKLWATRSRPPVGRSEPFDLDKLLDFADSIGRLSFLLLNPPSYGGRARVLGSIAFATRSGQLALRKLNPEGRDRVQQIFQEDKPPQSS
jgi:hypothetical protein